jgi:hypothetical protein
MDVWQAAAPQIDFLAPDIYSPNFQAWCQAYAQRGNPLFIPEMRRTEEGARQVFYALGAHDAMGVSPFAIDSLDPSTEPPLLRSYAVLRQIAPLILEHQGGQTMIGFLLDEHQPSITRELGGYELEITLDQGFGPRAEHGGGLIIALGPDEFLGAGFGFRVRFRGLPPGPALAGIAAVDEGRYQDGHWVPGRRLNGDETSQGRWWRFVDDRAQDGRSFSNLLATGIGRCTVYRYE